MYAAPIDKWVLISMWMLAFWLELLKGVVWVSSDLKPRLLSISTDAQIEL